MIILIAEVCLVLGLEPITIYFTPLAWTGYVLLIDSLIYYLKGDSLLMTRRREFMVLLFLSIGFWYIFEFYNLFLKNWHYLGVPERRFWRYLGYFWSFASIWPAILLTNELVLALKIFKPGAINSNKRLSSTFIIVSIMLGTVFLLWPIVIPSPYLAVMVWLGFWLLLDPFNHLMGGKSIFADWVKGRRETLYALFVAGLICGILWEFWNFWAGAKWEYSIPILENLKIFEMPVVGYLGFLPFACEVYVMYNFSCGLWRKLALTSAVATKKSPDLV